jgi:hypothetical protein
MKRIAIMAALVAVAACNKADKGATTDTSSVGGAVAPASDSTGAMGNSSGTMGGSSMSADSSSMKSGAMGGAMSGDTSTSKSAGGVKNQSQSGVTDSSGKSTLGPNVTKTSPTQGAAVTSKGDTLKKSDSTKTP